MVPVIYLTVSQSLTSETAFHCLGHATAESCTSTRQMCVRLLTLVNALRWGKQIALSPLEC